MLPVADKTQRYLEVDALVTNNALVWLQAGQPNLSLAPGTQLTVSLDMRIDAVMDSSGMDLELLKRLGGAKLRGAGPGHLAYTDYRLLYPDGTFSVGTATVPASQTLSTFLTLRNLSDQTLTGSITIKGQSITRLIPTIPEPGTWATFGLGLAGVAFAANRRRVLQA
jgi:PEP-CTERM motif